MSADNTAGDPWLDVWKKSCPPSSPDFFTPSDSTRITTLETRQADLERRIAQLERELAEKVRWPWIGVPYTEPTPISEANTCRVCGMRFDGIMGYVCPHTACPSRITCSAQTLHDTSTSDCGSVSTAIAPQFTSIAQMQAWQRGCANPTDWTTVRRNMWPEEYRDGTRGYPPAEIPLT